MAITRLWFFTLRPPLSPTDPAFTQLWADVLELCATYTPSPGPTTLHAHVTLLSQSCPKRPHHFLFQCISPSSSPPSSSTSLSEEESRGREAGAAAVEGGDQEEGADHPLFALISTYPSLALCLQADAAYSQRLKPRVLAAVRHRALRQIDVEDAEVISALLSRRAPARGRSLAARLFSPSRRNSHDPDADGGGGGGGDGNGLDGGVAPRVNGEADGEDDGGREKGMETQTEKKKEGADDAAAPPLITVTISSRDPLRSEVVEAMHSPGRRSSVPPPGEEMSGADVYVPPPPPLVSGHEGAEEDLWAKQRAEGKKWVRISRRTEAVAGNGDIEAYRLKEVMSR